MLWVCRKDEIPRTAGQSRGKICTKKEFLWSYVTELKRLANSPMLFIYFIYTLTFLSNRVPKQFVLLSFISPQFYLTTTLWEYVTDPESPSMVEFPVANYWLFSPHFLSTGLCVQLLWKRSHKLWVQLVKLTCLDCGQQPCQKLLTDYPWNSWSKCQRTRLLVWLNKLAWLRLQTWNCDVIYMW